MIKKKVLDLISFKFDTAKYSGTLFLRNLIYKLIPISLGIFFITIFFWPSIYHSYMDEKKIIIDNMHESKNFTFQGIDQYEQPFFVHAKKYQQITNDKNILLFEKPKAEINLKQGKWLTMVAKEGIFNIEKQTLELIGNVLFLHSDGQQIDTNNAVIDLKKAKIYGNKKIFGKNESINFSSEGFEFKQKRKKYSLFGKSKIKIKSTKN